MKSEESNSYGKRRRYGLRTVPHKRQYVIEKTFYLRGTVRRPYLLLWFYTKKGVHSCVKTSNAHPRVMEGDIIVFNPPQEL